MTEDEAISNTLVKDETWLSILSRVDKAEAT